MTNFYQTTDNASTTTVGYAAGSGSIDLAAGTGPLFGTPTPTSPILVTTASPDRATTYGLYQATGRTGDTLTGLTLIGGADTTLPTGYVVEGRWTAEHASQLTTAITAIEGDYLARSLLAATSSPSAGAINLVGSPAVNAIGATADACVVLGGTSQFPHSVGNASLALIPGGYDNHVLNDTIMVALIGAHHQGDPAGGHGVVSGGSYGTVHGDYGAVGGGTQNRAVGNFCRVGGGRQNTAGGIAQTTLAGSAALGANQVTTATALAAGRTVYIDDGANCEKFTVSAISGTTATLSGILTKAHASGAVVILADGTATDATVGGGQSNRALKLQATVGGGFNNLIQGQAGTIAGGSGNLVNTTNGTIGGGTANVLSGTATAGTIGGGDTNAVSAGWSTVAGGRQNTASGINYATVGGGFGNTASGSEATIAGGDTNVASGSFAAIGGGASNTAAGLYSGVSSGRGANAYVNYSRALAGGFFATAGDAQTWDLPLRRAVANATPTELRSDGAGERLALPNNTCWKFRASIVGWRADTNVPMADFKLEGTIYRQIGATSVALFGAVTKTAGTANVAGIDASATADTTLGGLSIQVTGIAGVTIRWSARLEVIEVAG